MEVLLFVFVACAVFGAGAALWDWLRWVWRECRSRQRSVATAIAMTCIVAAFPTVAGATLLEQQPPSIIQQALQMAGIVLMFSAGVLGGIGLVWDRRLAKRRSISESESARPAESPVAKNTDAP